MIGTLEQAMIDRVKAASDRGVLGYEIETVASYQDELDRDLAQLAKAFPAVWFVFGGFGRPTQKTARQWRVPMEYMAVIGQRNRRNEESRRRGTARRVGTYQMIMDLGGLLYGQTFGLDIERLEPNGVRSLFNASQAERKLSLYGLGLSTSVALEVAMPAGGLDDFAQFHADWDIPTFADPPPAIPQPAGEADATDDVTLETE